MLWGKLMSIINSIINKKLDTVQSNFNSVDSLLSNHLGPIDRFKEDEIKKILFKSYHYLNSGNPFKFGLLSFLPQYFQNNFNMKNTDVLQRYNSLVEKYCSNNGLTDYIDSLNKITTDRLNNINYQIADFYAQISKFAEEYIDTKIIILIKSTYTQFFEEIKNLNRYDFFGEAIEFFENIDRNIENYNKAFVEKELKRTNSLLSNLDGKSLDMQQRIAVVSHDTNTLVLAGAGSGKTTVLSAKAKYLVDYKKMNPEDILLISFTRKSADEMKQRISGKLGFNVDVKTFHKLGLEIISDSIGYKPDIVEDDNSIIMDYFKSDILQNIEVVDSTINFLSYYLMVPPSLDNKTSLGEIITETNGFDNETVRSKFLKDNGQLDTNQIKFENEVEIQRRKRINETIQKEKVKSQEEVAIANFLFLNGIEYEYEKAYVIDTKSKDYRQYKPDFYLTDYDIYIEHFGLNKDLKAPWLSPIDEEKYISGYEWKLALHEEHNTKLIQTFSYYNSEGKLLDKLKEQLEWNGIKIYERDIVEVYIKLYIDRKDRYFEELVKLVSTFISLLKSNKYDDKDISRFISDTKNIDNQFIKERNNHFLTIALYVYHYYQQKIVEKNLIDFNDMLNLATDNVDSGTNIHHYKMIIIDEFQDTSIARYRLVHSLLNRTQAKLLCVGDDWQSIYRFAGSDLEVFTNFKKFFGSEHLLRIENTYRNPQNLIDIAGAFVMKNPKQYRKRLKSNSKPFGIPITIIGYSDDDPINALKHSIDEIVLRLPEVKEILLIGRNNFDIKFLEVHSDFKIRYDAKEKSCSIKFKKYPNIHFSFLTAHRSKGLESEATILLNLNDTLLGFPNKIADDNVLDYVLTNSDKYDYGEERRLFYVALTRTKTFTYILSKHMKNSIFVEELIQDFKVPYVYLNNPNYINEVVNCPHCKTGLLLEREFNGSKFVACSNYPGCDYTAKDLRILSNPNHCPVCNGFLVERKRKKDNHSFMGCSNYPHCNFILDSDKGLEVGFD